MEEGSKRKNGRGEEKARRLRGGEKQRQVR